MSIPFVCAVKRWIISPLAGQPKSIRAASLARVTVWLEEDDAVDWASDDSSPIRERAMLEEEAPVPAGAAVNEAESFKRRRCPTRIKLGFEMLFNAESRSTLTPVSREMDVSVSPALTV
jgi:hypothetical protein